MKIPDDKPLQVPSSRDNSHLDLSQQIEEIETEQAEESTDSDEEDGTQLVCAGCLQLFDSENNFQAHICTGQGATDDQGQVVVTTGQSLFGQDHQTVQAAGNGTEVTIDVLGESGEPQQLKLLVDADGQISIESLLPNASIDTLQTED